MKMLKTHSSRVLISSIISCGCCACSGLPKVEQAKEIRTVKAPTTALPVTSISGSTEATATPVLITNARGTLSSTASTKVLKKRWQSAYRGLLDLAAQQQIEGGNLLIDGNKLRLLYDGPQTMAAMIEAIKAAKNNINLETYIFDQDALGIEFADLLIARQRSGIQVNIIYDSVGTIGTPQAFFDKMAAAGIQLLAFRPVNPITSFAEQVRWTPNQRDHRKILVVDGLVAFTGGVNISNTYANSSPFRSKSRKTTKVGWRDTHIKIEGPAVAVIQKIFLDTWLNEQKPGFEELPDSDFFPRLENQGSALLNVLASAPDANQDIYRAYLLALNEAKKTIHITCAYFVPDDQVLSALRAAVKRGVEVQLILPGVNDNDLVSQASKSFFSEMLDDGIQLFQLRIAVLHAKTAVIDGMWSTVGSSNIDTRSFLHNKEINVVVYSLEFGSEMESAFQEDLKSSSRISKEDWAKRSAMDRLKQWMARRLAYWL